MTPSRMAASGADSAAARVRGAGTVGRPEPSADRGRAADADGGLWRGPTEGPWIARLLRGAPAPRDPTSPPVGRIPRD